MNISFLFLFLCFYSSHAARTYGIVYADLIGRVSDVQKKLIPLLGNVILVDAIDSTPTLRQLLSYDALLVYSYFPFKNPTLLGDNLADYVDLGKGVVLADLAFSSPLNLGGRFLGSSNDSYYVLKPAPYLYYPNQVMEVIDRTHPILNGVSYFDGGSLSYRASADWLPNVQKIASWHDTNPLIGYREIKGSRRVDLNFYPVSSDVEVGLWSTWLSDGAKLMANALSWVSKPPCHANEYCLSCANNDCKWCSEYNECHDPDFTCTNTIVNATYCPIPSTFLSLYLILIIVLGCSQLDRCSTCVGSGASCSWCLDNGLCLNKTTACRGQINNGLYCSSLYELKN